MVATSAGQLPHKDRMYTLQLWPCEILFDLISLKKRINARVALIFKSIIILLIIFLGCIISKPC